MTKNVCLCCSRFVSVERHHVAGRALSPITAPACPECHRVLSAWQTCRREWPPLTPLQGMMFGLVDVIRLMAMRTGQTYPSEVLDRWDAALRTRFDLPAPIPLSRDIENVPTVAPEEGTGWDALSAAVELLRDLAQQMPELFGAEVAGILTRLTIGGVYAVLDRPARQRQVDDGIHHAMTTVDYLTGVIFGSDGAALARPAAAGNGGVGVTATDALLALVAWAFQPLFAVLGDAAGTTTETTR